MTEVVVVVGGGVMTGSPSSCFGRRSGEEAGEYPYPYPSLKVRCG